MEHNSCPSDLGLADNIKMSLQEKKRPFPRFLYISQELLVLNYLSAWSKHKSASQIFLLGVHALSAFVFQITPKDTMQSQNI